MWSAKENKFKEVRVYGRRPKSKDKPFEDVNSWKTPEGLFFKSGGRYAADAAFGRMIKNEAPLWRGKP